MGVGDLMWLFFVFSALQPVIRQKMLEGARLRALHRFERARRSRVIALVHRQETMSLLGFPLMRYIDVNDSEEVLRAIKLTDPDCPIDLIIHTPGGLVLAAGQIAHALRRHRAKVTVFVPHYAMSGGTLLALAADEIVMDPNAVLGPVDPQIGDMPAASIIKLLSLKKPENISDEMLILADMSAKARVQVGVFVMEVLLKHLSKEKAVALATTLTEGRWTHDFPITVEMARGLGLPIATEMPRTVYDLMDLYPQGGRGRPSVLYVPLRPGMPERGESTTPSPGPPVKGRSWR